MVRVEKQKREITCTGEKLLVDRINADIIDFFDSNTIFSKYYSEFSYEDIEYFKKAFKNKISEFGEKFKIKIDYEINIFNVGLVKIESNNLKITANSINHDRCLTFLNGSLKFKQVENFSLKNKEVIDYFYENKGLNEISKLEERLECAILTPIALDYFEKSKTEHSIQNKEQINISNNEIFTAYCLPFASDVSNFIFIKMLISLVLSGIKYKFFF